MMISSEIAGGGTPPLTGELAYAFPATFAQQRLWFLDRLNPGDVSYLIPWSIRIAGGLDSGCLERALIEIVRRHDIFRTKFAVVDGEVMQIVSESAWLPSPLIDLTSHESGEREARRLALEESRQPLDLSAGPLIRARLLRLGPADHILLVTMHHIIFDRWSRAVWMRELSAAYEAFVDGKPSPLPDLPLQYADYAVWQREYLRGAVLETQLGYWKRQLAGAPAELALPNDRPRPVVQSFRGATKTFHLSDVLTGQLNRYAQQRESTLFMVLMAAFDALLSRYSGQDDIVVGAPISGRNQVETENLIGFFANTLAIRLNLSGDPDFDELLGRAKTAALDAYKHQDLPFEKLVQEINPERSSSRNPLFQVVFSLGNASDEPFKLRGLELRWTGGAETSSKFDLSLFMRDHGGHLSGTFEYSADLFDESTIERMTGHYRTLLEAVAGNPALKLSEFPLLTEAEKKTLLTEWNDPAKRFAHEECVHNRFERQAELTPDKTAIVFEGRTLTYGELNQRSNQLAHRLRFLGAGPGVLVGICMERSIEMVIGVLGILKAGAAYLPLDPAYPAERLSFTLADSRSTVLLTQAEVLSGLQQHNAMAICIDADWPAIARESSENPVPAAGPGSPAYVIYTSGSTGNPKGCLVTHANLARLFSATDDLFGFGPDDTWTLFHSISFDFSVWEMWGALLYGGELVVVPLSTARSPRRFHELLVRYGVTVLCQTPSAFRQLILADQESEDSNRLALRYVIFGGEALEFRALLPWFERHGNRPALINGYGITETTVFVSFYNIDGSAITDDTVSLIGKPMPDLQVYVLDNRLCPVPIGVTGEMYIGGPGVTLGYLNRPELTAERFIPDPFQPGADARLYKSGDLARYMADGNLQYMGRIDHQVKIRGFRIELGEIEAVLCQNPAVKECVVIAREDVRGDMRLVVYAVLHDKEPASWTDLRALLQTRLPEYMVPSAFVSLPELPLTNNGKIDRNALPAPEYSGQETVYTAPRTPLEAKLVAVWSEVLKVSRVGVHDDFFALGGHSLLAVELFARMEGELGEKVPLNTLFSSPTVAQLAGRIGIKNTVARESSIKPCRTDGSKPPLFAAHGIGGTVLTFRSLSKFLETDQPIYCLEALALDQGWKTLEELASHYVRDIREFQPCGPYHLIGSSFGGMVAFEIARQLHAQGHEVGLVGLLDSSNMGARNLMSSRERLGNQARFVYRRVTMHLKRFPDRSLSQWPRYAVGRIVAVGRRLYGTFWRTAYRSFNKAPAKKPSALRNMKRAYELAGMDYVPQIYPGRVVLFRRTEQLSKTQIQRQHGWTGLAAGGLEIVEVPGDHNSIMSEPNVKVLAQELTGWLARYSAVGESGYAETSMEVDSRRGIRTDPVRSA